VSNESVTTKRQPKSTYTPIKNMTRVTTVKTPRKLFVASRESTAASISAVHVDDK
jgi:hypothetical protein